MNTNIIPSEVKTVAKLINSGNVGSVRMKSENGNFECIMDSSDSKSRIIIKKQSLEGFESQTKINLSKPNSPSDRRERVKHFLKNGLSQTRIAELCMCSQKTISNDVKKING